MGVGGNIWKKITQTKALVQSSGDFEILFFESIYRVSYAAAMSTSDDSIWYILYQSTVRLLILLFIIGEICFLWTEAHHLQLDDIAACINVIGIQIITIYKAKNMMDHRAVYRKVASSMESPYFDTSTAERKRLVRFWAGEQEKYLKLMLFLGNCTLAAWHIYPLIDELEYNLMVSIYIPFDYNTRLLYPLVYLVVGTTFMYISHIVMVTDLIMQAHLVPLVCEMTVLSDSFVNIIEDCRYGTDCTNELIKNKEFTVRYLKRLGTLTDQHKLILSYTMDLRTILSGPLLGQMAASGILICFVGYQASTTSIAENIAKSLMSMFYLGYNMLSLYVICRWCEEITTQSKNIGDAAYRSGWEAGLATLPGVRSTIKMVIARANKPLVFSAGGMYSLSLQAYTTLVKTSYSALTVLLRFRHD